MWKIKIEERTGWLYSIEETHLVHLNIGFIELLWLGEDRAVGVYADYYTFGASLFNFVGNSRDGPARPGAYDHHIHVIVEGPEDLLRRPVVVGQRVADIVVLEIKDLLYSLLLQ